MKTFTEFTGKEDPTVINPSFPTFEEATTEKTESKGCVSEKVKSLIKEMMESGMMEMKACHEDESDNTAETYMKECDSYMKECMEGLKTCMESCTK
jgi:hypothetical protein